MVINILKGKTTPVEVARQLNLTGGEIKRWAEEAGRNMGNGSRVQPKDVREQYEKELQETREAPRTALLPIYALKSIGTCSTTRRSREIATVGAPPVR